MRPPPPQADPSRWHVTPPPGDWRKDGACHNQPYLTSDIFYPPGEADFGWSDPSVIAAGRQAKAICAGCPVTHDCYQYAMETNQPFGIWAGLDPKQRRAMRPSWLRFRRGPRPNATRTNPQGGFDGI